jgi:methyltransferase (TIGR00027 family)
MTPDRPSQTALATAFLRALHLAADDRPYVFEDHPAADYLPGHQQRFLDRLTALPARWRRMFRQRRSAVTRMRAQVLVRARYAEDALASARQSGVARYLILAAGLDTFAQRRQDEPNPVPVLEVDHPATQRWKRDRLARLGGPPDRVSYVPVDFQRQALEDAVAPAAGPQVVSWLGATYYLSRDAMAGTLAAVARLSPPGSRLILDYWRSPGWAVSPGLDDGAPLFWGTRLATALQQEPLRCFLEPGELEALARAAGWQVREDCAPEIQDQRYLRHRRDGLRVPSFAYLAHLER